MDLKNLKIADEAAIIKIGMWKCGTKINNFSFMINFIINY